MSQQPHNALDESFVLPTFSDDDFTGDQADLATMSQQPQSAIDESLVLPNLSDDDFAGDQADLAAISQQQTSAIDESSVRPTLTGNNGTGAVRIKDATPRTTFRPKPYHIVAFPTRQQMNTISPFFSDDDFAGDQADLATMSQQPQSALDESLVLPTFNDEDLAGDQADLAAPQPPWWRGGRGRIIIIAVILLFVILGGIVLAIRLTRRPTRVYQTATVTQGNFALTISATGPLQGGIYNINFSGSGIISELDVKVGQTVKQGQVLAILNKTSLQDAVNTAQATVMQDITTVNNNSSSSGATQAQSASSIAGDQKAVTTSQTNLSQAQAQATASVSAAQTGLSNSQTNLSKVQAQSSADVKAPQTPPRHDP